MLSLKNFPIVFAAFIFSFVLISSSAQAGNLTLINQSGFEIHAIYISDSGTDDWEENIIEGYMLPSGNQMNVEIQGGYQQFDLLIEDGNGNSEDYRDFPGRTTSITFKGGGQSTYR